MNARFWFTWILRVFAGFMMLALPCVFMPISWMDAICERSGLGPMPTEPVAIYMARHLSLMYALTGVLLMYMSLDVDRHFPLLKVFGWGLLAFGAILLWIDVSSGMPTSWTVMEAGPIVPVAVLFVWLLGQLAPASSTATIESDSASESG